MIPGISIDVLSKMALLLLDLLRQLSGEYKRSSSLGPAPALSDERVLFDVAEAF
jgi:hypothetical protein